MLVQEFVFGSWWAWHNTEVLLFWVLDFGLRTLFWAATTVGFGVGMLGFVGVLKVADYGFLQFNVVLNLIGFSCLFVCVGVGVIWVFALVCGWFYCDFHDLLCFDFDALLLAILMGLLFLFMLVELIGWFVCILIACLC